MNTLLYKIKKVALKGVLITSPLVGACGVSSCSDWNDHYDEGGTSNSSIWEQLTNNPQLSDFMEVIQAVKVTRQNRATTTSYAELLQGGRTLTVFAPVNGTFNKDSILNAVVTNSGDSVMEKTFAENHLISDACSFVGDGGGVRKMLLNGHYVTFEDNSVNGIEVAEKNISCKNGVIHIINKPLPYSYTIYEALTNLPDFYQSDNSLSPGSIFRSYNVQEFDEKSSTSSGTVEGINVYVDSVTQENNRMLDSLGCKIKAVDSSYVVAIPSINGWKKAFDKALLAYRYPTTTADRDSIQKSKAFRALLNDAFFSMTTINSRQCDSIVSVKYNPKSTDFDYRYHVFKNPYKPGGILYDTLKTIQCCNGTIYAMRDWSLGATKTYHKPIEVEGEKYKTNYIISTPPIFSKVKTAPVTQQVVPDDLKDKIVLGDSISKGKLMVFKGSSTTENWNVTFRINGTLSAKYDINAVLAPVSVIPGNTDQVQSVAFTAFINYIDEEGKEKHLQSDAILKSDKLRMDTISLFKDFEFPACNDGSVNNNVSITLETVYDKKKTSGCTAYMYLDQILLIPKED